VGWLWGASDHASRAALVVPFLLGAGVFGILPHVPWFKDGRFDPPGWVWWAFLLALGTVAMAEGIYASAAALRVEPGSVDISIMAAVRDAVQLNSGAVEIDAQLGQGRSLAIRPTGQPSSVVQGVIEPPTAAGPQPVRPQQQGLAPALEAEQDE
jgi:hypothetical protein